MNVQTIVENRLIFPLPALNAALGTTLSFPPMFCECSVKTDQNKRNRIERRLKTEGGHFG
jgi:hypothetical protein